MDDWTLREIREFYARELRQQIENYIPRRYQSAKLFADCDIDLTCSWYIFGPPGRGKTHTAYAVQRNRFVGRSWAPYKRSEYHTPKSILIENVAELIGRAKCMDLKERRNELKRLSSGQDLILDDIGSENVSAFTEDFLFQIINHRHDNLRYTGFTSNFNIGELPYDPRIKSRIKGMVGDNWAELKGEDMRLRQSNYKKSLEAHDSINLSDFEYRRQRIIDNEGESSLLIRREGDDD